MSNCILIPKYQYTPGIRIRNGFGYKKLTVRVILGKKVLPNYLEIGAPFKIERVAINEYPTRYRRISL